MRYPVGARVRLKGLKAAEDHNGKCGSVVGHHRDRYKVKLEERILEVKETNLEEVVVGEDDETTASEKQEDSEVCPICLEALPMEEEDFLIGSTVRFFCCGSRICKACSSTAKSQGMASCPLCRQGPPTKEENLANIRRHASKGRGWACYQLGERYYKGNGVRANKKLAYEWYRKAGDTGHILACHLVGHCYEWGSGVKQSYPKASEWYEKAAIVGFSLSQFCYAVICLDGTGRPGRDVPEVGLRFLRLAAEQGTARAQEQLAITYQDGAFGVEASLTSAITWGLEAAKQNDSRAQFHTSLRLVELWHDRIPPAAMYWFRKAAAQRYDDSLTALKDADKFLNSHCAYCQAPGVYTKRCSRCYAASYCSTACQRKHWKDGHKKLCCDKDMDISDFELCFDDYVS